MTWVALAAALLAYTAGGLLTARGLFRALRPYRVPACTKHSHYPGRHNVDAGAITPQFGLGHGKRCYQRRRADGTLSGISTDREAARKALLLAVAWPAVLAAAFVTAHPPELAPEKDARLAARDKKIARDQAALDRARARELEGK